MRDRRGSRAARVVARLAAAGLLSLSAALAPSAIGMAAPPATAALTAHPDDPLFPQQWGLLAIGAPQAWARDDGQGVTIAIVDTGVDPDQPDLAGKVLPGYNFVDPGTPPDDANGHGTALAGIAAADTNNGIGIAGVAPGARILPVKVLGRDGEGSVALVTDGIEWAVAHGAGVVNLSLSDMIPGQMPADLQTAINRAWAHGVVCVLAAGNHPGVTAPHEDDALVVTALGPDDVVAPYTSWAGTSPWALGAPGGLDNGQVADDIASTYWTATNPAAYAYLSGTSMAAAFVSGAVADLLSGGLSPAAAVRRLLQTATPLSDREVVGRGALDLGRAVSELRTQGVGPVRVLAGNAPTVVAPVIRGSTTSLARSTSSAVATRRVATDGRPGDPASAPPGAGGLLLALDVAALALAAGATVRRARSARIAVARSGDERRPTGVN